MTVPTTETEPRYLRCADLRAGLTVELTVYGESYLGRIVACHDGEIEANLAEPSRLRQFRSPMSEGTALISVDGGALSVRVSCWAAGDRLRMRALGPAEFIQRRMHARYDWDVPAMLSWAADADGSAGRVLGRTADISFGGLRMAPQTTVWPSPGVTVQLMLECADGPLRVQAEVLGKTADYGLRLRFTSADPVVMARISRQIELAKG